MRDIVKEYQKKFRRNHQPVRELAAARRGHCQNGRISVR